MKNLIDTFNNKNRPPFWIIWVGWFIGGICDMIDGLVNTLTLCCYYPGLGFTWRFWIAKKQIQKKRK